MKPAWFTKNEQNRNIPQQQQQKMNKNKVAI